MITDGRTEPRPASSAPRRGINRPYSGRAALSPPPCVYRAATAQLAGLYPFLYGGGVPAAGPYIGTNLLTGAAFSCHPTAWLHQGLITNPNVLITGIPARASPRISKPCRCDRCPTALRPSCSAI